MIPNEFLDFDPPTPRTWVPHFGGLGVWAMGIGWDPYAVLLLYWTWHVC